MGGENVWITVASILGAVGVALGAFGAHALSERLDGRQLEVWSTAVDYQLLHAVALFALAAWGSATGRSIQPGAALFTLGVLAFSGSLYVLALGGPRWLGPITPIGGLCLIAGWVSLAWLGRGAAD